MKIVLECALGAALFLGWAWYVNGTQGMKDWLHETLHGGYPAADHAAEATITSTAGENSE